MTNNKKGKPANGGQSVSGPILVQKHHQSSQEITSAQGRCPTNSGIVPGTLLRALRANLARTNEPGLRERLTAAIASIEVRS